MRDEQFGSLRVRVCGGEDGKGAGDGPLVIFLHGFGAPGTDLVPFGRELQKGRSTRFAFPEAPIELGPMYGAGRAWWHIDMMKLERALMTGQARQMMEDVPEGMEKVRDKLSETIATLEADLAPTKLVLGGFSQGAMLSTEYTLMGESPPDGLVIMSGTYLAKSRWKPAMEAQAGLPVIQSHGTADPLLPFAASALLGQDLAEAGLKTTFLQFAGAHEIPRAVLAEVDRFLTDHLHPDD